MSKSKTLLRIKIKAEIIQNPLWKEIKLEVTTLLRWADTRHKCKGNLEI
jgi:hypothetical protein